MTGLILISHGPFAKAALETVKMLQGEPEHTKAIAFETGESIDKLNQDIDDAAEGLHADEILVMVDILGGSPFNASAMRIKEHKFNVLTGINVPSLLEILPVLETTGVDELSKIAVDAGKKGIIDVAERLKNKQKSRKKGKE